MSSSVMMTCFLMSCPDGKKDKMSFGVTRRRGATWRVSVSVPAQGLAGEAERRRSPAGVQLPSAPSPPRWRNPGGLGST